MSEPARMPLKSPGSRAAAMLVAAFVFTACTAIALGADDNRIIFPSGTTKAAAPAVGSGGLANTLTLIVALILAGVGGWIVWRNRQTRGVMAGSHLLSIDETRSLGNRQYLVVASYQNKKFLLGVCQGRIDMLAPLNDDAQGPHHRL